MEVKAFIGIFAFIAFISNNNVVNLWISIFYTIFASADYYLNYT
jgi:hypothetical protein